jgi:hypothetical protein
VRSHRGRRLGGESRLCLTRCGRHRVSASAPNESNGPLPEAALRRAADVLREHGRLRDLGGNRAAPTVAAVIRSGFGDMSPALVVVADVPAAGGSRVRLDDYALEGLIRQRAAAKAVRRVAELLSG